MQQLWNDPELARRMGARAEQRYHELFTSEQMASNYTALYQELVGRRKTAAEKDGLGLAGLPPAG
jgi:rhamnosyl/mannosyltransferase